MSGARGDCRAQAARVITEVLAGRSLNQVLPGAELWVPERDRGLLRELCYGSLRWYPQLVALIDALLQKPLKARDADLRALLVIGAYQLRHMNLPPHAALSSVVEACRHLQKDWACGLVNGVLRNLQRRGDALLTSLPDAARTAHPEWLYQSLRDAWGTDAEGLLAANNSHPPMCLRVNRLQGQREARLADLAAASVGARACELAPSGIRLDDPRPVEQLPGFAEGQLSVQDEASQLAAPMLTLRPGMRVLDACCAPGGKTGHLLECEPGIELLALDLVPGRLRRVEQNLERTGLHAKVLAADVGSPADWWDGQPFDAILLDAPCSGSGVIRRHPDIKLLRRPGDIPALAARQGALLDALWPCLAHGGQLLYTTCSVLPQENDAVITAFLARTPGAREQPIEAGWGLARPAGRQLLTTSNGPDGFYFARLEKP